MENLTYDDRPRAEEIMERKEIKEEHATKKDGYGQQLVAEEEGNSPVHGRQ